MEKLRECPFCGDEVGIREIREVQICCHNCGLTMFDTTKKNLIDTWNTRFTPGYETPEQYKARTGKDWPDDAPVYALHNSDAGYWWQLYEFSNLHDSNWLLVCATEAGKPSADWRPGVD